MRQAIVPAATEGMGIREGAVNGRFLRALTEGGSAGEGIGG